MRTLKESNIEYRPLYQTRHSFASQMIQNGEDIIWVVSMLGHSSPKMTLDKYAKYVKSETKKRGTFISNVMCTE
jgi:integrase